MRKSFKQAVLRKSKQSDQDELAVGSSVHSEDNHSAESAAEHAAHIQQPPQPVQTAVERLQVLDNPIARQSAFKNLQNQYGNSYATQVARCMQHGEETTVERSPAGATAVPESIKKLHLAPEAEEAATTLWEKNPDVVFNSGLRTLKDQSRAMSGNVLKEGPNWLDIYADKSMVAKLKEALNADWATIKKSKTAIADTMFAVFSANQSQAAGFSRHLRGLAFDMQPGSCKSLDVKALPNLHKFLTKEGGLTIWHAQFKGTGVTPVLGGTAPTTTPATGAGTKGSSKETTSPTKQSAAPVSAELTGAQQTLVLNSLRQGIAGGVEGYDLANQGFFALHPNMQGKEIGKVKDATAREQYKAEYMYIYKTLIPKAKAQPKKTSTTSAESGVTLDQISKYLEKEYPMLYSVFSDYLSWKTISQVAESLGTSLSDFYESVMKSVSSPTNTKPNTTPSTTPKKTTSEPKTDTPKDAGDAPAWRTGALTEEMVNAIISAREAIPEIEAGKGGLSSVKYAGKENAGLMYTPGQSDEEKAFSKSKSGKTSDGTAATAQDIVWEELASEGSSNSINTYDGQGMTWGRGFAAGGLLPDMLWRFFGEVPGSRAEFNSIGIDSDGKHIYTVDVSSKKLIKGNDELHDLRNDRKISSFFIHMGQKHPKALVEAQFETVTKNKAGAANVPDWALKLPKQYLQFIGHASHWYSGAFAWSKWQGHTEDWSSVLHRYVKLLPGRHMYRTKGTASGIVHESQAISYAFGSQGHGKSWEQLTEDTLEAAVSVEDVETLDAGEYFKVGKTSYRRIKN